MSQADAWVARPVGPGGQKGTGREAAWSWGGLGSLCSVEDALPLGRVGRAGFQGMGSQAPAEPLTFEPEVCLVISWGCHQGQIPVPREQTWVSAVAQLKFWVVPGVVPVQGGGRVLLEV